MSKSKFKIFIALIFLVNLVSQAANAELVSSKHHKFNLEKISDFSHPWGMAELPNQQILVTERGGNLWLVDRKDSSKKEIKGLPKIAVGGQSGLLDVAVSNDFEKSRKFFFSYGTPIGGSFGTAISSAELTENGTLKNLKTIFKMNKPSSAGVHFGSRIVVQNDGTLFFTIGDRGAQDRAQDPFDHAGSVLRINQDGSIPKDNPFSDEKAGAAEVWSIGHRNPQGAAINPETGELFSVEHGARGGDEINTPKAGLNYGWPVISYGKHYSGQKIGIGTTAKGYEQPEFYWDPSIAPSGMAFHKGPQFPKWAGSLFVGALKDRMLVRLEKRGNKWVATENMLKGKIGRIRDVRFFQDGSMWLLSDEVDGGLYKVSAK